MSDTRHSSAGELRPLEPENAVRGTPAEILRETLHEVVGFDRSGSLVSHPYEQTYHVIAQHAEGAFSALDSLEEQLESSEAEVKRLRMALHQAIFEAHRDGREPVYKLLDVVEVCHAALDEDGSNPADIPLTLEQEEKASREIQMRAEIYGSSSPAFKPMLTEDGLDTITGDSSGVALPPIDDSAERTLKELPQGRSAINKKFVGRLRKRKRGRG